MQHQCQCCQELRTVPRTVTLHCADGSRRTFRYSQVEECGCVGLRCEAPGRLGLTHSQDTGRWSRGALLPAA